MTDRLSGMRARAVSREREDAIISYLKSRYNLPSNQFGSANGDACETNDEDKATPCIRLKLIAHEVNKK